jgi:predicted nucleic acid-binding protein
VRLFADTAAWLNLYDRREAAHTATRKAFEGLQRQRVTLYVTDYVLDETLTIIQARVDHAAAVVCGQLLLRSPAIRLVHIDAELWAEAWQMFQMYDDKDFSFTDCTSFVVMRRHKLLDAFTVDHHFEQMGFRLWPRPTST